MAYQAGDRVGDYEVVDVLGAGGMGKVYKVRNVISDRLEAMKVLLPNLEGDPELADRFVREIKVQASLQHPNIAGLHTALRIDNQLLMMLEYVEGKTLESELRNGRIPTDKAVEYVQQVLTALAYAHARGIVHRDIKPANMMLTGSGVVKLMDFGIARIAADQKLTQTGRTVGSLYYMSPEQINGADLDARSDLYSLGISLYELVTKSRPFQGDSDYSIMAAHLEAQPVPPIEVDPSLPRALNDIILMSIAKDPAQRFQSADAFRAALRSVSPAPVASSAPTAMPAPPRAASSRRGVYMALGSIVTVAVLAVAALQGPKLFESSSASSPTQSQPAAGPAAVQSPLAQPDPPPVAAEKTNRRTAGVSQPERRKPPKPSETAPPVATAPVPTEVAKPQAQQGYFSPATEGNSSQPEPPAAPQPDPILLKELREMGDALNLLDTRANSARSSIKTLREQQKARGYGLRGDIEAAEQRMLYHLTEAESALKAEDAARAKQNIDSAERALEQLEKFLGR
jgi:serine/threonine-protein kinase